VSAAVATPGDRACRYALSADAVLYSYAKEQGGDLVAGLQQVSEDASVVALAAIESGDVKAIEAASLRYCKAIAVFAAVVQDSSDDLLLAAQGLMESTKDMIDAEVCRLMAIERGAIHATPSI